MKLLILDGNSVINRAYFGVKPLTTREGLYTHAVYGFLNILERMEKEEQPDAVAVEELFWGNNVTTGIGVSHGRGVILLAIQKSGVPLFEYTPNQVKQAVVGYGGAEKHQVMDMTRRLLHMEKVARPDDAADAIAIALCHARSSTSLLHQKGYLG